MRHEGERTTGARGVLSYLGMPRRTDKEMTEFAAIDHYFHVHPPNLANDNDDKDDGDQIHRIAGSDYKYIQDHASE